MHKVYVLGKFEGSQYSGTQIDTTSGAGHPWCQLSPFYLNALKFGAMSFENLWQYSKVYSGFVDENEEPTASYFEWRDKGFSSLRTVRYPVGRKASPLYFWWDKKKLSVVEARKKIYAPIYAELVKQTQAYAMLETTLQEKNLILRDYDGYDYRKLGMTLKDVVDDPERAMGHSFVLAMLLTDELQDCISIR